VTNTSVQGTAIEVLKKAGESLHAAEIAKLFIEAGLWKSDGNKLEAAVSARLYSDIKSNCD
jgi:restriction system protein